MEAKVDIRKLQVLSDRINQATEALNQVRASVHGLGHTSAVSPYGYGIGGIQGQLGSVGSMGSVGMNPIGQQSPVSPFGMGVQPGMAGVPGLQHSTGFGSSQYGMPQFSGVPYGLGLGVQSQMIPGVSSQINPWLMGQTGLQHSMQTQQPFGQQSFGQSPFGQSAYGQSAYGQSPYGQTPFYGSTSQSNVGLPFGLGSQVSPFGVGLQHSTATQQSPMFGMGQGTSLGMGSQIPGIPNNISNVGLAPEIVEQRVLEARASDPFRLAQTFPYAFSTQAPVGIW